MKRQGGTASKRAQGEGEGEGKSAERHRHSAHRSTHAQAGSPCMTAPVAASQRARRRGGRGGAIVVNEKVAECGTYGVYV